MTTGELVDELAAKLGNRTDITNDRYVRWLNWAMLDIAGFHRQRIFPSVWFHELEDVVMFALEPLTGTVAAATSSTVTLAVGADTIADRYNNTMIELTGYTGTAPTGLVGQQRVIIDYSALRVATLGENWMVTPDVNTDYTVYRKGLIYGVDVVEDAKTDIYAILRLERANDGTEIEHVAWETLTEGDPMGVGTPAKYARHGNTILFDVAPDERMAFRAWVYRYPEALSALELLREPILPDQWEEVILLGALWRGFESLMEPDRADEAKKQYVDAATNRNGSMAIEAPYINRGIKVRRDY